MARIEREKLRNLLRPVVVAWLLIVAACGGSVDSVDSSSTVQAATTAVPGTTLTSSTAPTTATTQPGTTQPSTTLPTTTQPSTTVPTTTLPSTTLPTTTQTPLPPGDGEAVVTIPVGGDGVEYRGGGDEQEITGPSLLAIDPAGGIHIVDPVGLRVLSYLEGDEASIDLEPIDVLSVTAMAATTDHLILVEIFFQPERNRIHRLEYDGNLRETIELPVGFRLEDGLSGVRSGPGDQIVLEFEGGSRFGIWDGATFAHAVSLTEGGVTMTPVPPDLLIGAWRANADLTMGLGGLRYLGTATDGSHLIVREDVTATDPLILVDTSIEWYSSAGVLVASALVPPLGEQFISTPPGIAMFSDGRGAVLVASEDQVRVVVLKPRAGRI